MKNLLLILSLSAFVLLAGCKKEATLTPSVADQWVGIYNVPENNGSGLTQIQVTRAGDNSIKVVLKITQAYYQYTATTLQNVTVAGTSTASISETQNIIEATDLGPYSFSGSIQFSNGNAVLSGTAISVRVPYNSDNSPMNFSFSGKKVHQ